MRSKSEFDQKQRSPTHRSVCCFNVWGSSLPPEVVRDRRSHEPHEDDGQQRIVDADGRLFGLDVKGRYDNYSN